MESRPTEPKLGKGPEVPKVGIDELKQKALEERMYKLIKATDSGLKGPREKVGGTNARLHEEKARMYAATLAKAYRNIEKSMTKEEKSSSFAKEMSMQFMKLKDAPQNEQVRVIKGLLATDAAQVPPFKADQTRMARVTMKEIFVAMRDGGMLTNEDMKEMREYGITFDGIAKNENGPGGEPGGAQRLAELDRGDTDEIDGKKPQEYYDAEILKLKNASPDKVPNPNDKAILDGKMMSLGFTVGSDGKIETFKPTDEKSGKFERNMHKVLGMITTFGGHIGKLQEKYPGMFGAKKPAEAAKAKPVETDADKLRMTIADKGLKVLREESGKKKADAEKAVTELIPKLGNLEKDVAEKRTAVAALKEPAEKQKGETELQKMQTEVETVRGQLAAKQAEVKQAEAQLKQYEDAEKAAQKEKGELQSRFDELVVNAKAKGKDAFATVLSTAQVAFDADKLTVNLSLKPEGGEKALVALKKFLMEQKLDANAVDAKSVIRKPKEFLDSLEKTLSQTV